VPGEQTVYTSDVTLTERRTHPWVSQQLRTNTSQIVKSDMAVIVAPGTRKPQLSGSTLPRQSPALTDAATLNGLQAYAIGSNPTPLTRSSLLEQTARLMDLI
jgi:hypothetical protein